MYNLETGLKNVLLEKPIFIPTKLSIKKKSTFLKLTLEMLWHMLIVAGIVNMFPFQGKWHHEAEIILKWWLTAGYELI